MRNILTLLAVLLLLCSCRTVREYVPLETVIYRTDTLWEVKTVYIHDSDATHTSERVSERDSIAPILDSLQRVIGWERWHWMETVRESTAEKARLLAVIDSLERCRSDSIDRPVPYPVTEYVEVNRLHWWQSALMWLGGIATLVLVLLLLFHKFK